MAVVEVVAPPGSRWCARCAEAGGRGLAVASLNAGVIASLTKPGEPLCIRHAIAYLPAKEPLPPLGPVALVGPPAVGKTTVGRELAARLGQPWADVDAEVEARAGRSVAQIFEAVGEPGFRERELEATLELLRRGGVVCLGGGAVTTPAVRGALRGLPVVWLASKQAPAQASTGGRPLLDGPDPEAAWLRLAAQRAPLYAAVACLRVDRAGWTAREIAAHIATALGWPAAWDRAGARERTLA